MSRDSFMEVQVTEKQDWYEVDGPNGTEWVPCDLVGSRNITTPHLNPAMSAPKPLRDYLHNDTVYHIKVIRGYGVRLSAPGYMDCTDWTVYTNKREALRAARELEHEQDQE